MQPDGASARPVAVILNHAAGSAASVGGPERIADLFAARGREAAVTPMGGDISMEDAVRRAVESGCAAVVAAGGDGTVNAVAGMLLGGEVPLGILPIGTLNHFAKDLGIPLDLEEAVDVIVAGRVREVDAGRVNGRTFLNNSSIGVYPRIVQLRERYRERGLGKWIAAGWATLAVLRRRPFLDVRIRSQEDLLVVRRTSFILVGNNEYRMTGLHAASRKSLTGGRLAVYVMKAERRGSLLHLAWHLLRYGVKRTSELDLLLVEKATVETRRASLQVALDGEIATLRSPLEYRILPGAIRVLAPERGGRLPS